MKMFTVPDCVFGRECTVLLWFRAFLNENKLKMVLESGSCRFFWPEEE